MITLRLCAQILLRSCCLSPLAFSISYAADYVGAKACAECHRSQYDMHVASHHFQSLRPIDESMVGRALIQAGHSPDNLLRYDRQGDAVAAYENGVAEPVVLEWGFGAGAQGSTPVGRIGGQFIEHRFSYYSRIQGLAPTFGHPPHVSTPIAELGVFQDNRTIFRCFNCHGTGAQLTGRAPDLTNMLPGVQCERCHGPGTGHITAAKNGSPPDLVRRQISDPGRLPAKAQIEICGQCHRLPTPDSGDQPELENPVVVRFAPVGLLASSCFRATGTLSCLTCHNPHENARPRTEASYSEKCLGCHENDRHPVKLCRRRSKQDCLPCHMKQASLGPYLKFTDHRIRVYE